MVVDVCVRRGVEQMGEGPGAGRDGHYAKSPRMNSMIVTKEKHFNF